MPTELQDLLAQRAEIERKIAEAQREGRAQAIAQIKALMAEHNLTAADVSARAGGAAKSGAKAGSKVPAKFRNAQTGESWSGRGLQPKWLKAALGAGAKLEDFAI